MYNINNYNNFNQMVKNEKSSVKQEIIFKKFIKYKK